MNQYLTALLKLTPLVIAALFLGGCVTATVQEVRERATGIVGSETVVVLGRRSRPSNDETEIDFIRCVADNLNSDSVNVITEQNFVDATFPWFEPRTAPINANELPALLDEPLLANALSNSVCAMWSGCKVKPSGSLNRGSMTCGMSPGGGGCFGFLTWENDASYEASVWDTQEQKAAGRLSSDAAGTSYMPALVLPIQSSPEYKKMLAPDLPINFKNLL